MGKPFLKWAGGKRQILDEINLNLPEDMDSIKTYIEPFSTRILVLKSYRRILLTA